jgi:hypothetical protein
VSKLVWGAAGERYFETGIDRGVLYVGSADGVVWNGLTSVDEAPQGGSPRPFYYDGVKYLNIAVGEEFEGTINAFSSPPEFDQCDGVSSLHTGLLVTHQPRKSFGFSYRTRFGNDTEGQDYGYKIHIVYNALAAPSQRSNETTGDTVNPIALSWGISTLPPSMTGYKPTAHLVVHSRRTPPNLLAAIEDILYGTEEASARLPSAQELLDLFGSPGPILARNRLLNPAFRLSNANWTAGSSMTLTRVTPTPVPPYPTITTAGKLTPSVAIAANAVIGYSTNFKPMPPGAIVAARMDVYRETAEPIDIVFQIPCYNAGAGNGTARSVTFTVTDQWTTIHLPGALIPAGTTDVRLMLRAVGTTMAVNEDLYFTAARLDVVENVGDLLLSYFDGDSPDDPFATYEWEGAANASESVLRTWY